MNFYVIFKRIAAYLIDIVLLFVVLAPVTLLVEQLVGVNPQTPRQVWIATILSFSIPTWSYFVLSDRSRMGATLGKRLVHLRVTTQNGSRLSFIRAFVRTAVKLLPWEMAHIFGFALADQVESSVQATGLVGANILVVAYLGLLFFTQGKRSLHDLLAGTQVRFDEYPGG